MEKDAKNIEFQLKNCDIFSQLAPQEIAEIAKAASFRDFDCKELIFNAGDKASGFYIIISGRVEVSRSSENGRRQVLHVLGEGQSLGEVRCLKERAIRQPPRQWKTRKQYTYGEANFSI